MSFGACSTLREALRPILSSDDGADSEASSDTELGRMQRLPGQGVIQAAASLASDMAVQVGPNVNELLKVDDKGHCSFHVIQLSKGSA